MPGLPETDSLLKRERISLPLPEGVQAYRIRLFEIADALRETNFAEPDMRNKRTFAVVGEEALVSKLTELEVSLAILRHPRDVDYPL
jgi:hypothetical protein